MCSCHFAIGRDNSEEHCATCAAYLKEQRAKKLSSPQHAKAKLVKSIDDTMSLIVRIRGDWTCIKCKRLYPPFVSQRTKLPAQNIMTNSHYFGRGKWGTRFDFKNTDPMCIFCHQKVENHKEETVEGFNYKEYMLAKLGEQGFELLRQKSLMEMHYREPTLLQIQAEMKKQLELLLDYNGESEIIIP